MPVYLRTDRRQTGNQGRENWMNDMKHSLSAEMQPGMVSTVNPHATRAPMCLLFDLDSAINSANAHEEEGLKRTATFIR